MSNSRPLPPVRIRRRPEPKSDPVEQPGSAERLIADPARAPRKKRLPNRGSFKRGEPSRNPKGRPKGAKGKKALVRRVLLEPITVRLPTGQKRLSVFEALLLKERDLAFSGDWRARKTILEFGRWALPEDMLEDVGVAPASDAEADRAILEWFEEEVREKERQKSKGGK
jgi:hypothetical protein